ncbi:MAG: ASCH domain-containing protein [Desulfurellales bacterium]|nr:MAG: ASCH domain-containing protein [Desulfurellales bacterium]
MKALTISQPFASLIASGEKWIENRRWATSYRGDLAIHAGKGLQYLSKGELAQYPSGGVIAIARLTACVTFVDIASMTLYVKRKKVIPGTNRFWSEAYQHRYAEGPWCWILEDVRPCDIVAVQGKQGLWEFTKGP